MNFLKKIAISIVVISCLSTNLSVQALTKDSFFLPTGTAKMYTAPKAQDLFDIWQIDSTKVKKTSVSCAGFNQAREKLSHTLVTRSIEGVIVNFYLPNPNFESTPLFKAGEKLVQVWLQEAQAYFGPYPCPDLNIFTPENFAGGTPGYLGIGGNGGFNYYWLLWHELTHSYFGTHSAKALWLREGASNVVPSFMIETRQDLYLGKTQSDWTKEGFGLAPPTQAADGVAEQFKIFSDPKNGVYQDFQVYFKKNACDLQEPLGQAAEQAYKDNSNWGRMFLFDLAVRFGKEPVKNALKAVYEKYRYTNLTKISDRDFYDALLYHIDKKQTIQAKQFLAKKLCIVEIPTSMNAVPTTGINNGYSVTNPLITPTRGGRLR
ncbi:MAG: hypothetical protein A2754_00645 [Candidatus Magasanikbacteria bacterium RIFCSPHIGHO2_01_FULL_47_8]|uniref:Peptidase M1 membrane alanine aminopeptidase domain-containing protein n=1 Tax=Candidatus Magasanikbacteria bacterium RIFCSPHIGHO2_01_FULL_47_8 TaxID=1798673 RepID=A0A1F6MF27_9BACT|nr:MAG: hypothetical protein A2754_00645 [Candidatus Magasanikbacteria bacterium RIFCSPHIGHO2_01_FULL_47_8]